MLRNKNVDFLFLIEHEDREFYSVQKISEELKLLGASSLILSLEFFTHLTAKLEIKTIVIPYAISTQTWPLKYILRLKPNVQIVSLNWEQHLSEANKDFKKPRDAYIKKTIFHLAWSSTYKKFLVESGVLENQIKVIGNPLTQSLFEFVSKETGIRTKLYSEFYLDNSKRTIFLPMNYGWAFFSDKQIKKKVIQGYNETIAYEYRAFSKLCLQDFCNFVKNLTLDSSYNVVIRPHPSISVEQYNEAFRKYTDTVPDNVTITKKYTIKEWISVSEIIGSSWSTSVWDAANIGKSVFLFTPYNRPQWLNTWWNDMVPNISTVKELSKITPVLKISTNYSPFTINPRIASWLIDLQKNSSRTTPHKASFKNTALSLCEPHAFRCRLRVFCMRFLKGLFIRKGMRRDYFLPYNVD